MVLVVMQVVTSSITLVSLQRRARVSVGMNASAIVCCFGDGVGGDASSTVSLQRRARGLSLFLAFSLCASVMLKVTVSDVLNDC